MSILIVTLIVGLSAMLAFGVANQEKGETVNGLRMQERIILTVWKRLGKELQALSNNQDCRYCLALANVSVMDELKGQPSCMMKKAYPMDLASQ